jgi:hypothetical protein
LHWWQFDVSSYVIWTLERLGLARDVYRVPVAMVTQRAAKKAIFSSVPSETLKPAGLEEA